MSDRPWFGTYAFPSAPTTLPPPLKISADDVRGLRTLLDGLISNSPLVPAQRSAFMAIRERLAGLQKEAPPSVAVTAAEWLRAIAEGKEDLIVPAGNALLSAVQLNGDGGGAQVLLAAMQDVSVRIVEQMKAPAAGGDKRDAGSAKGLDWYEPDAELFFVLSGQEGRELAGVVAALKNREGYKRRGLRVPNRHFWTGKAGTGKTMGGRWVASQLGVPLGLLRLDGTGSVYVNGTSQNIRACAEAVAARKGILLIDEIEGIGGRRDANGPGVNDENLKTTAAFQQLLDANPDLIVIGATNYPDKVDPSVKRRLRKHVHFGPPPREAREAMAKHHWRLVAFEQAAWDALIDRTDGTSGDVVERVAEDSNHRAMLRGGDDATITAEDVLAAVRALPREEDAAATSARVLRPADMSLLERPPAR